MNLSTYDALRAAVSGASLIDETGEAGDFERVCAFWSKAGQADIERARSALTMRAMLASRQVRSIALAICLLAACIIVLGLRLFPAYSAIEQVLCAACFVSLCFASWHFVIVTGEHGTLRQALNPIRPVMAPETLERLKSSSQAMGYRCSIAGHSGRELTGLDAHIISKLSDLDRGQAALTELGRVCGTA